MGDEITFEALRKKLLEAQVASAKSLEGDNFSAVYRLLDALADRERELVGALEPFAEEAATWPPGLADTHEPFPISQLKLAAFRRAARAITGGKR